MKKEAQDNLLDRVIANITEDQIALREQNDLLDKVKSYKKEIVDRIRDSRKDLVTFVKYATPDQLQKLKDLEIDVEDLKDGVNKVASLALEILEKTPKGELTNGELFEAYQKRFKNKDDALNYTEFNIKCRSLFNSQRLLRKETKDAKSSREHIISVNGFKPKN